MRSLDVVFDRGSGGSEGSSLSASSSSNPVLGVYCDDGVRRSPADVNADVDAELFFFESG